jgi:outer membrane lipoprotein-sorting protein
MKIVFSVLVFCVSLSYAGLKTLSADFLKISTDDHGRDSCLGQFFYRAPADIYLAITFPVDQSIYVGESNMVIQYPSKKLAMKYTSKTPFSLPFFQALLGAMEGEGAISRSGFAMAGVKRKGDTTETDWIPSKGKTKKGILASMKVIRYRGRILRFGSYDEKGNLMKAVSYGDFQETLFGALPCRIRTEEFGGKALVIEEFILTKVQLNPVTPVSIENWRVPPDFAIKEFQW